MQNIAQVDLAKSAGISERTLRRFESGHGGSVDSLVRILIALKLDSNLSLLIPDHAIRPMERARQTKSERRRASKSNASINTNTNQSPNTVSQGRKHTRQQKTKSPPEKPSKWTWGDEQQ